jgi:hypothetical protein
VTHPEETSRTLSRRGNFLAGIAMALMASGSVALSISVLFNDIAFVVYGLITVAVGIASALWADRLLRIANAPVQTPPPASE